MSCLLALLLASPAAASRLAVPRLSVRAPVTASPGAVPLTGPALSPLSAPSLAIPSPAPSLAAPADAPSPGAPVPGAPAPDGLMGKTARSLAVLPPDHRDWDREVFEELFSGRYKGPKPWTELPGSPQVAVGATLVDKRAPGARELLKTLVLPDERPVLGLFHRERTRIVNGVAMGTQGVWGHRDAVPPGLDMKDYAGYSLRLALDGTLRLVGSGTYPAEMTPRLLRALQRYYGLTPAAESRWGRLKRGLWAFWDGLGSFLRSKS